MVYIRLPVSLLLGICMLQGVIAAKYCFCEASPDFYYLGIEEMCQNLGDKWGAVNCDFGTSDICKYTGDGDVDADSKKTLDDWCQSEDREGTDLSGQVVKGGKLTCTDAKPEWAEDFCSGLGDKGLEPDDAGQPLDLSDPTDTEDNPIDIPNDDQFPERFIRRATPNSESEFLFYSPDPESENLVKTARTAKSRKYSDGDRDIIYQINELRLIGYDWRLIKSFDNRQGAVDHTDSVEVTYGFERSSGTDVKAELKVNFGYSNFGASFGMDASLSTAFFSHKKEQGTTKRTDSFPVPKGEASYLYQKVYKWESKAWVRFVRTGTPPSDPKIDVIGNWTVATENDEPLQAMLEFEMLVDSKVIKSQPLSGSGTFKVRDQFRLKNPLYPMVHPLNQDRWRPWLEETVKSLGFET